MRSFQMLFVLVLCLVTLFSVSCGEIVEEEDETADVTVTETVEVKEDYQDMKADIARSLNCLPLPTGQ